MENDTHTIENKTIVHLKGLTVSHENGILLSNVNLDIREGEFVYLIGKSGAGKTSLLRSLYADRPIDGGEAEVCGFDIAHLKRRHIPQLRRRIGIVFQNFRLLDDRNVYSNLEFILKATGWKKKEEIRLQVEKVLHDVGIADKAYSNPLQLSEGEQQRVGIARALINNPTLILADEPTGNLDPDTTLEVMKLLRNISENGQAVLMATHNYTLMQKYPSRIANCKNGTVVCSDME